MLKRIVIVLIVCFLLSSLTLQKMTVVAGAINNKLNFSGLQKKYSAKQVIIVSVKNENDYKARLDTYQEVDGAWKSVFPQMDAMVGMNGISRDKLEGDRKSPAGIFRITQAFGTAVVPPGLKLPYTRTTKNHYWVDDAASSDYNKMVSYEGDPFKRWNSFEKLTLQCYKYVLVIDYNTNPVVKKKGSAIFLHKYSGLKEGSFGCTEVSEQDLIKILNWIDSAKNPVIIQGTASLITNALNSVNNEIRVVLNGKELIFDVVPVNIEGHTLVPARKIFEELGMTLDWDEKSATLTGKKDAVSIVFTIGHSEAYINGIKTNLNIPPQIVKGRMMVPIRFISVCFGAHISWEQENNTVSIKI